jgi:excisionase family DNA binding protein
MSSEHRFPSSAERRYTHAPNTRSAPADSHYLDRRIGPVWLTVSQLCRRWQLDRKTIYKFIDSKILPAWKIGNHLYRISVEDVLRFEGRNKLHER